MVSLSLISGADLKAVDRIRNLGVIMTPSLSPFEHIVPVTAKAVIICSRVYLPYHKRRHAILLKSGMREYQ